MTVPQNASQDHNARAGAAAARRGSDGIAATVVRSGDNPAALPETPIIAIHRSDSSGTTDNFTTYLDTAADDWPHGHGKDWKAPGGLGKAGTNGVADAITTKRGSIGYVEWAAARHRNLSTVGVFNGGGAYARLSAEAASATIAASTMLGSDDDLRLQVNYQTTARDAYPIVMVVFEIVCTRGIRADRLALLAAFLGYVISDPGQELATDLGYAPVPASLRTKVASAIAGIRS
ncbi:substrate-binding domain-containing protein [Dactylosporangium sp. CA-139066]|uniref:substrate-binding domain-containing protein n=1 Tax=Dactylosporangium sp. CA-139066 TaxID=3239930 RepID=UPI003D8CBC6A